MLAQLPHSESDLCNAYMYCLLYFPHYVALPCSIDEVHIYTYLSTEIPKYCDIKQRDKFESHLESLSDS